MKTTLRVLSVAAVLAAFAAPLAAQEEAGDSVVYRSAPEPVLVMVEDTDDAGVHRVGVAVLWDDHRSSLPFSFELLEGDLVVLLASGEGPETTEACAYRSGEMAHGSEGLHPAKRAGADCYAPPTAALAWVAVEYFGRRMACVGTRRANGPDTPERRLFACYWPVPPDGG